MNTCICTLVMNGNKYIPGAVALAHSARYFSLEKLVCMVTEDVTDRKTLQDAFDEVVLVERITVKGPPLKGLKAREIYGSWINDSPTKFQCIGMEQYDKVLFMDADTIIVGHIDDLFSLLTPAGMFDHLMAKQYVTNPMYTGDVPAGATGYQNVYNAKHGEKVDSQKIKDLYKNSGLFAVHGGIMLFKTCKFAVELYKIWVKTVADKIPAGISSLEEISISLFYVEHGYLWTLIDMRYNVAAFHVYKIFGKKTRVLHYITPYKPWTEKREDVLKNFPLHVLAYDLWWKMYNQVYVPIYPGLKDRLHDLLGSYLGDRGREAVDRAWPIYQLAFVHKSVNPVVNYELLEAYGDKFLAGQYMWILNKTPGILEPELVTLISNYFLDRDRLGILAERLGLTNYIQTELRDEKLNSDVMEAFIGAVGLSWERLYKKGDLALHMFISKLYKLNFEIDVLNYEIAYGSPLTLFNELLLGMRLEIDKVKGETYIDKGMMIYVLSYNGNILGEGRVSMKGLTSKMAVKQAKILATTYALKEKTVLKLAK